ncbi:hypothetical protein CB0940_08378 [Cercospora beticola]|uniref:Alpha-1,3-mannosyltransferase CMT1 n=1 Tax=Cercospora beticola TaxID=122368 RepID=A0A2G5HPQ5_CERBT|nr:hypothetical protein CB0940_08378 [Cercospora beticola]PIA94537.1 hypothetical protein CB0940_08378 [Cercospora beticola]WPB04955.1 hypothetical protein RHO25_009603 [Cercospora beticola]CAK1364728.1 unnamed protein product [Cercospora beticola]
MAAKDGAEEALLYREQSGSSAEYDSDTEYELDDYNGIGSIIAIARRRTPKWWRSRHRRRGSGPLFHAPRRRRSPLCRLVQLIALFPYLIFGLLLIAGVFFPGYSHAPLRYQELRDRVLVYGQSANIHNEKVFIAASLYDQEGEVVSGEWGQSVLHLINILGPQNVFLSIYENDPDPMAKAALDSFSKNVTCAKSIVAETLDLSKLHHVSTPDGTKRLKRIEFLADVRNRALRPLEDANSVAHSTRYDKLLYLNDVVFDPIDAANLLFSTNANELTGRTQYRAACATDFIMPFKFYDTFATRDLEGYDMGVPFYPWFTGAGKAESRKDVLEQKDAVRVKSCWGGMVAFEAMWFQMDLHTLAGDNVLPSRLPKTQPAHLSYHPDPRDASHEVLHIDTFNSSLRFRAEHDTYWDGSECCLIHADLTAMDPASLPVNETGIYMNPYVRVAYSSSVLPWLHFVKRFERLYTPIHTIVDWIARRPSFNPRQFQEPGDEVIDEVWTWDAESLAAIRNGTDKSHSSLTGTYKEVKRTALPGGFCGARKMLYINEDPSNGLGKWASEKLPPVD